MYVLVAKSYLPLKLNEKEVSKPNDLVLQKKQIKILRCYVICAFNFRFNSNQEKPKCLRLPFWPNKSNRLDKYVRRWWLNIYVE